MRDKIFVLIIFIIIIAIPVSIFFRKEKNISVTENRVLLAKQDIKIDRYINDKLNTYLQDQFIFGETLKNIYNNGKNKIIGISMNFIEKNNIMKKIPMGKGLFRLANSDYIVYKDAKLEDYKNQYLINLNSINNLYEKHKDKDFFVYNIVSDDILEYKDEYERFIREKLDENIMFKSSSQINNWEDYKKSFYKTDHHWSKDGQYAGYVDIANMMEIENIVLVSGEKTFDKIRFYGSKARELGNFGDVYDSLVVNEYDYPDMLIEINRKEVADYGDARAFYEGKIPQGEIGENYYADFYGTDYALIKITVEENKGKENILIFSNSYSNPINKLIASSFYNTYIIDLRHWETQFGEKFDADEFIESQNINRVLIIGGFNYFKHEKSLIK